MNKQGKLHFYSETGTEGGHYALQDSRYIQHVAPEWGVFGGQTVYDPKDVSRSGKVKASYREDGSEFTSSKPGEVSYLTVDWEDNNQDKARPSDTICVEQWDYDGLILLREDDRLTIFERGIGSVALWSGVVKLEPQDPYAPESYAPGSMACHSRPYDLGSVGADAWSAWFFERRWATVVRSAVE